MSVILIREEGQAVTVGRHIRVRVRCILADHVELIVEAPDHLAVAREEVAEEIKGLIPGLTPRQRLSI